MRKEKLVKEANQMFSWYKHYYFGCLSVIWFDFGLD